MRNSNAPVKAVSAANAAVARQLDFLGKALGRDDLLKDILPDRASQPSEDFGTETSADSQEQTRPHPDAPQLSALEKLRQRGRQPTVRPAAQPMVAQPMAAPVRTPTTPAQVQTAEFAQAPPTYKSWGGASRVAKQAPAQQGPTEGRAFSSVDRLRKTAQGIAPKRLESRDNDQWSEPLVKGGAKLPKGYPDEMAWPSNLRPPGSLQDDAAWWCAKTGKSPDEYTALDEGARSKVAASAWVVEIMGPDGSALMCIPKSAPDGTPNKSAGAPFGEMFNASMLVVQDGRPSFAAAAEPKRHRHGEQFFWVIRPRDHYLEANTMQSLYCNATWASQAQSQPEESQQEDDAAPIMSP